MKIERKLLFFYLNLDEDEQVRFRSLLGPKIIRMITAPSLLNEALQSMEMVTSDINIHSSSRRERRDYGEDYDIAVMQLVRHIGQSAPSNVELARSVGAVIGQVISRPEKRSRYEMQGMLLEALMNADRDKLLKLRTEMMHGLILGSHTTKRSDLDRWFSIILGNMR
ncbi:MAG: hypothetical protein ACYDHW_01280 [Syntrophorhabdaceae bacterium]